MTVQQKSQPADAERHSNRVRERSRPLVLIETDTARPNRRSRSDEAKRRYTEWLARYRYSEVMKRLRRLGVIT